MKHNKSKITIAKEEHMKDILTYTGTKKGGRALVQFMNYDEKDVLLNEGLTYDEIIKNIKKDKVNWIHFDCLTQIELIEKLGEYFDIHNLMLEDILNVEHLPKVEFSEKQVFITLKILSVDNEARFEQEHVSFILGDNYLVSFQEEQGKLFNSIKEQILKNFGMVRKKRADYLFYLLLDSIVDNYFVMLENLRKSLEYYEDLLIEYPNKNYIHDIQKLKKQILFIRKYIFALREAMGNLINEEPDQIDTSNIKYLRDIQDHVNYIFESIEIYREDQKSLLELNNSNINNSMNQVMKTLTIVTSIFIPLTFITGVYGMNFHNMPELKMKWGYVSVLGLMGIITIILTWYMKRKKWF